MDLPKSPRILIVKLTAIGDVIHALPVACALRDAWPKAHLAWLVEGRAADVLLGHRALDEVIPLPRRWYKSPRGIWRLRRTLRAGRFDVTLDLQGLTKSAAAAWLSGAKHRLGFAGEMARELSGWFNNRRFAISSEHVVDRYRELLAPLGVYSPMVRFDVPRHARDILSVDRMLASLRWQGSFALLNPGAGWPSKRWPPDRFASVARHLGKRHGLPAVVVWAGDDERKWALQIAENSSGHAVVAPDTTLPQLAELARRAVIFIGSDTGPLHLSAAVGTPCVGLFGPMPGERNGPYGVGHITLQKARLEGTSRQRRTADNATMLAITAEDVMAACDSILARHAKMRQAG
jgi:lipopolysaccharide heptosyltransferase I